MRQGGGRNLSHICQTAFISSSPNVITFKFWPSCQRSSGDICQFLWSKHEGEGEERGWGKLSSIFDNFSSFSFLSANVPLRLGISATELSHEGLWRKKILATGYQSFIETEGSTTQAWASQFIISVLYMSLSSCELLSLEWFHVQFGLELLNLWWTFKI